MCDVNGDVVGVHRNKRTVSKGPLRRVMGGRVQAVGEVSDACIEYNLTKKSQVTIDNEVQSVRDLLPKLKSIYGKKFGNSGAIPKENTNTEGHPLKLHYLPSEQPQTMQMQRLLGLANVQPYFVCEINPACALPPIGCVAYLTKNLRTGAKPNVPFIWR